MTTGPSNQMIPGAHPERKVVDKTVMPDQVSVKNPQPVKVTLKDNDSRAYGHDKAGTGTASKFLKQLSIATQEIPSGAGAVGQLTDYIKKMDPQNSSGAVKPALDIMDKLLKQGSNDLTSSVPGVLGSLQGILQQFLQQQTQQQQQQVVVCPKGYKWQANTRSCVLDPTQQQDAPLVS